MKTRLIIGPLLIALVAGMMWFDYSLTDDWWERVVAGVAGDYELGLRDYETFMSQGWNAPWGVQPWCFLILATTVGILCALETVRLLRLSGLAPDLLGVLLGGAAMLALTISHRAAAPLIGAPTTVAAHGMITAVTVGLCFAMLITAGRQIWHRDVVQFPRVIAGTCFAVVYVFVPVALIMGMRKIVVPGEPQFGLWLIIWLVATCRLGADSCAYFVGKAIGKHKLIPHVSPGKTVEGFLGGLAGAVLIGWGCYLLMPGLSRVFSLPAVLGISAAFGVVTPIGDLVESALKRAAGVKDSGKLLPEFGGALDLVDGFLLTGPLLFLILLAMG